MQSTQSITLRPELDSDNEFLAQLYASTRAGEMAAVPWPESQKLAFLQSQFQLQQQHYRRQFAGAHFLIIESSGNPLGRLYYCWEAETLRLIDIALAPGARGQGLGRQLLAELMSQVRVRAGRLFLHVDIFNPAREWYLRLGFTPVDPSAPPINGVYQQLHWFPPSAT